LTQLAHTFRPRRKGRRSNRRSNKRYHALQALAIRDKKVYVLGAPEVPDSGVRIYIDVESNPEEGFVYLIGMIVNDNRGETQYSFCRTFLCRGAPDRALRHNGHKGYYSLPHSWGVNP